MPLAQNRVFYKDGKVHLDLTETNAEAHKRLRRKLREICSFTDIHPHLFDRSLYLGKNVPIGGTAHQAGTLRFGEDPTTSVLDTNCKAHELDNLYVTDASFFPSIGAVNPTLTIIANALRVADHLVQRMGARDEIPPAPAVRPYRAPGAAAGLSRFRKSGRRFCDENLRSSKDRSGGCVGVPTQLCLVGPGGLARYVGSLIPHRSYRPWPSTISISAGST